MENRTDNEEDTNLSNAAPAGSPELEVHPRFKWYCIVVQSGVEKKALEILEQRIKKQNLEDSFGRIVVPTQMVEKIDDKGKKKQVEKKIMPGYVLIQMELNDKTYQCVRQTPKISTFLGATNFKLPPALTEEEVDKMLNKKAHLAKAAAEKPKTQFEKGEKVKVIDGPFSSFVGEVDEVKSGNSKLRVLISVFGRATPVEIEMSKVEKLKEGE
jgi:transcription termination/antitermination protein NusG